MSKKKLKKEMITCGFSTGFGKYDRFTIESLNQMIKDNVPPEYADTAYFYLDEVNIAYDPETYTEIFVKWVREETDEEFQKRKEAHETAVNMKKEKDLAELERLKKLYES